MAMVLAAKITRIRAQEYIARKPRDVFSVISKIHRYLVISLKKVSLSGRYYMERGCSSYAPFEVGGCAWSETDLIVYNTAPNSFDTPYLRTKRDLATKARMTRCFCQGLPCAIILRLLYDFITYCLIQATVATPPQVCSAGRFSCLSPSASFFY